jgi:hypothetical protein
MKTKSINSILALILSAASSGAIANNASRVPLTPQEAINLGLDPHDPALFRLVQNHDDNVPHNAVKSQTDQNSGAESNYSVSAREQRGASSEVLLQDTADGRWCETGSGNAFADIGLNLPSGALLTSMRIWGFDQSNTNDLTVSLIERCTPNQQAGSVFTSVISERSSSGSAGNFTSVIPIELNNSIDNDTCSYTLRTRYSTPGNINLCAGSVLRLQKIRLTYAP